MEVHRQYEEAGLSDIPDWACEVRARVVKFNVPVPFRRRCAGQSQCAQRDGSDALISNMLYWALKKHFPPNTPAGHRLREAVTQSGIHREDKWVCPSSLECEGHVLIIRFSSAMATRDCRVSALTRCVLKWNGTRTVQIHELLLFCGLVQQSSLLTSTFRVWCSTTSAT